MRENMGLFRGKRIDNGEWVEGYLFVANYVDEFGDDQYEYAILTYPRMMRFGCVEAEGYKVDPTTTGECTSLKDKNGKLIFEGDIVEYNTFDDFDCYSIVKIGCYKQDGSCGEYSERECLGAYAEVDSFTCPDWADNDPSYFSEYLEQQNLAEVNANCEIIGNIHDNPELVKEGAN